MLRVEPREFPLIPPARGTCMPSTRVAESRDTMMHKQITMVKVQHRGRREPCLMEAKTSLKASWEWNACLTPAGKTFSVHTPGYFYSTSREQMLLPTPCRTQHMSGVHPTELILRLLPHHKIARGMSPNLPRPVAFNPRHHNT